MLKIKKIIILAIPILLLCGCEDFNADNNIIIETYCDKEYGIEYIRDVHFRHGGITVRLDSNGNVIHCK